MDEYLYDVALSFANEQREYVESVAKRLSQLEIRYFYDNHEKVNLWGKNLLKYLNEVYFKKSRYCVVFISKEYKEKYWTQYESESIEERSFYQNDDENFQQYILPVRFDDTEIPGIRNSLGFIYAQEISPAELAEMIHAKLQGKEYPYQSNYSVLDLNKIYLNLVKGLPPVYASNAIKKSVFQKKIDAILLFNNKHEAQSEFTHYDAKIFLDATNKMWILNLGFFSNHELLYEITPEQLINDLLIVSDNSL